ncbi:MAG TPA: hypothetical protein VGL02_11690 [Streptomyces sp.]
MWPGDQQSGGEKNPQGAPPPSNPYPPTQPYGQPAQPYDPPSPYAQPGYQQQPPSAPSTPPPGYQQPPPPPPQQQAYAPTQAYGQPAQQYDTPSPYAQPGYQQQPPPGGYPTPQAWGPPVPGGPESGPPDNRKRNIGIAVVAALAVIAAVVVGVVATKGDSKNDAGKDTSPTATTPKSPTATATPTPTATATDVPGDTGDDPRGAPGSTDVKAVVPGWKVVKRAERNVAFDVPPDWTVDSEGMTIGFTDKSDQPAVAMGAPAYYKHAWCKSGTSSADRAAAGTKGANGATSVRNAAEVQATAWAYWAYQTNGKGTFSKVQNSKPFTNANGISGWQASATASNLVKANKCSSPGGAAYTVAWSDPTQTDPTKKLVVWVLYCDRGVSDQLSQSVIDKIKSSIRPLKK